MPLKIRCPHCQRVLIAEDAAAGQQKVCPACAQPFNVPLREGLPKLTRPHPTTSAPLAPMPKCPRCGTEVSPTATHCFHCLTDLRTGKRLPWRQRLHYATWRFWLIAGTAAAVLVIGVAVGLRMIVLRPPPLPTATAPTQTAATELHALVDDLFAARDLAARQAALRALRVYEPSIAPHVASALAASLETAREDWTTRGAQQAAMDLLARCGSAFANERPAWAALCAKAVAVPALRAAALRARGLLGDAAALTGLADEWDGRLAREFFIQRLARVTRAEDPLLTRATRSARNEAAYIADGLRALAAEPDARVFDLLAERYWNTWSWLGQDAGDQYADAVFELARPPEATLTFRPEDVRQPRDVLKAVAGRGAPEARAAAALILSRRGPQYQSLSRQICDALATLLPTIDPLAQQRLVWTIAQVRGRIFGHDLPPQPADVTREDVAAALAWFNQGRTTGLAEAYQGPPRLVWRAVTPEKQLEGSLLGDLAAGWSAVDGVTTRWRSEQLGCTAGVRQLLDPAQRTPNYAALAAGLIIVAEGDCAELRPLVELWREALDQPAWVRGMAYLVLGSLDARAENWRSGWPAGLDFGDVRELDKNTPGWDLLGRILAAGGPGALGRLETFSPAPLPPAARTRLLEAARAATEQRLSGS